MKKNIALDGTELADRIVEALFINGQKEKADRLVLEGKDKRDLGGWCKDAVRDVVLRNIVQMSKQ